MNTRVTLDEHRLWVIFHQAYDIVTRCEDELFAKNGVTAQQFLVLWVMEFIAEATDSPVIITDLAPSLYRSINSVSSIVDRMEKSGLIKKIRNLPDRRAIRLKMTPKGRQIFNQALKPSREQIKKIFSVYSEDEMKTLLFLLKKLKAKAGEECAVEPVKVDPELSNPEIIAKFLEQEEV
jgi:DNA-binding MarR family transcriptional regulator